jgi:hypothetical protein
MAFILLKPTKIEINDAYFSDKQQQIIKNMLMNDEKYLRARVDKVQEMLEDEEKLPEVKTEIIFKNAREKILDIYESLQKSYNVDMSKLFEINK